MSWHFAGKVSNLPDPDPCHIFNMKKLFESGSTNQSIALRTQLHMIKVTRSEFLASYFMRVTELRDQLGDIGETISNRELSIHILRGLPDSWESFCPECEWSF